MLQWVALIWDKRKLVAIIGTLLAFVAFTVHSITMDNKVDKLTAVNEMLSTQLIDVKNSRDYYQANYDNLLEGLNKQAIILSELKQSQIEVQNAFSGMHSNLRKEFINISNQLNDISSVDVREMSCEQAIDYLKHNAIGAKK